MPHRIAPLTPPTKRSSVPAPRPGSATEPSASVLRRANGDAVQDEIDEAEGSDSSASASSAAAAGDTAGWDGRRRHVIDRALDYAALAAKGLTDTAIARRRRKSRGYVSILRRLGQAIANLPPAELGAFRTSRIGFALAQRLVRADVPPAEIRAQLRSAAGGFSTHGVDYRRRGLRRSHVAGGSRPPERARPAAGWTWAWDATLFQQDPIAYVRAHAERVLALQTAIARRAAQDVEARAISGRAVGQPLSQLAAAVATARRAGTLHMSGGSAAELAALRQLEALSAAMATAIASVLDAVAPVRPAEGGSAGAPDAARAASGSGRATGSSALPLSVSSARPRIIPLSAGDRAAIEAGDFDD